MRKLLFITLLFIATNVYASDYHQSDSPHKITYVILDTTGTPVSGQTVGVAVERAKDGYYLDWSDNTFKASGWTTRMAVMSYNSTDGFYYRVMSVDNGGIISGDYCVVVSNDNATYKDRQVEVVELDNVGKLIKIHR